jgi:hypothetical protein
LAFKNLFIIILLIMGFRISPFDAYERAERQHDKFNRKNKTQQNKLPTLEEQLRWADELEGKARQARLKKAEEDAKSFGLTNQLLLFERFNCLNGNTFFP